MSLSEHDVKLSYKMLMGRDPSEEEVRHTCDKHSSLAELRQVFLNSAEFEQKYSHMKEQRDNAQPPTLVHLHIPKTAGTTIAEALSKSEKLQPNMIVHDNMLDDLRQMPRPQRRALRYVRGHLSMGAGDALEVPYRYICLIRKPGPRIFSFYQFIRRTTDHPSFRDLNSQDMSFGEYLEYSLQHIAHRTELDNGQIRRLGGIFDTVSFGQETTLLRNALYTALDPKLIFGFVEHMDLFVQRLIDEGYLETSDLENFNVSPNSDLYQSSLDALTPAQRNIFDSYTAWDTYFYDVCHQLFAPHSA